MKIAGVVGMGLGWLMMIFGVGGEIANLHAMNIALGLIVTGGFLLVAGSVQLVTTVKEEAAAQVTKQAKEFVDPAELAARIEAAKKRLA